MFCLLSMALWYMLTIPITYVVCEEFDKHTTQHLEPVTNEPT